MIAATNRDIQAADGGFRKDLLYRLATFPIELPPLRERRADIPALAWHFVHRSQISLRKSIDEIPDALMRALVDYDWPGNVRELRSVLERAMILSSGRTLQLPGPLGPKGRGRTSVKEQKDDNIRNCTWIWTCRRSCAVR